MYNMKKTKKLDAFLVYIITFALLIILPSLLYRLLGLYATAAGEILLIIPAFLFIKMRKESVGECFGFSLPTIRNFFAAAVLMAGANLLQNAVSFILYPVYYKTAENGDIAALDVLSALNPFVLLVVIAILPAICEEMLFRGYLLWAFTDKRKRKAAFGIIITAVMFALMHFDIADINTGIYKLPFTLIMGLAFGYIAYKTGSILLSAIFHFISNANALISYYTLKNADEAASSMINMKDMSYVALGICAAVVAVVIIAFGIRLFSEKKKKKSFIIFIIILIIIALLSALASIVFVGFNEAEEVLIAESAPGQPTALVEESFELKKDTICIISVMFGGDEGRVSILNEKGEYVLRDLSETQVLTPLEKGNYTFLIEFEDEEDNNYIAAIYSFGEYEGEFPKPIKQEEPGGIDFED